MDYNKEKEQVKSHYDLKNKKPVYLEAVYPYKAVGDELDILKLDDPSYVSMEGVLYELKCPNCDLSVHVRGTKLKSYYERFLDVGCPECKLQFNGEKYVFKNGEKVKPLPDNDGRFKGFIIRKVIKVPEHIFEEYAMKLFNKQKENLTVAEGNEIAEEYYRSQIKNGR